MSEMKNLAIEQMNLAIQVRQTIELKQSMLAALAAQLETISMFETNLDVSDSIPGVNWEQFCDFCAAVKKAQNELENAHGEIAKEIAENCRRLSRKGGE